MGFLITSFYTLTYRRRIRISRVRLLLKRINGEHQRQTTVRFSNNTHEHCLHLLGITCLLNKAIRVLKCQVGEDKTSKALWQVKLYGRDTLLDSMKIGPYTVILGQSNKQYDPVDLAEYRLGTMTFSLTGQSLIAVTRIAGILTLKIVSGGKRRSRPCSIRLRAIKAAVSSWPPPWVINEIALTKA